MNVDPSKEVTVVVQAGHIINALAALGKQPYEQVAATVAAFEKALVAAVQPPESPAP